jgi:serine protease Do
MPRELTSYRDVVKKVLPAVVSIESKARARARGEARRPPGEDERVPEEFRKFFEDFGGRTPFSDDGAPNLGFGSGFLVDAKGVVLTNHHVVEGAENVEVTLLDGRKFTSKDIKSDSKTDLAIVRLETKEQLPYLELGDSDAMEIGDRVLAVGAPFGLTGSVTHGIISAKGRSLRMNMYEDFLQTDAAINPGNSGGPLVNLEGKVIGINSAIKTRGGGGFQGVGLAIASNLAKNIMTSLQREGVVRRGYLGVQIKDIVDRDLAERLGVAEKGGVLVAVVIEESPSAKAGIQEGDVIVSVAGKPVKEGRELQLIVAGLVVGKPVDVNLVRDGKPLTLKVAIEEQPQSLGSTRVPAPRTPRREKGTSLEKIGVEVTDLTRELAEQLGYRATATGALILEVDPDGVAAAGGIRRGMLITRVDKQVVRSAENASAAVEKGSLQSGILLHVQSPQGGTSVVILKAAANE